MNNKKGFSLIITLILSFVALGFIAALLYLITTTTSLSGKGKKYTTALEAAKGLTDNIIDAIITDSLKCNGTTCTDNGTIDPSIINAQGFSVVGTVLKVSDYSKIINGTKTDFKIYLINLKVNSTNSNDKSEVEFAYEVEK